jgi:hypothetical protein
MSDKITTGLAAESGHWYKPDGTPAYQIPAKSGALRDVTLRDARKLGLVPSVTSIIREAAAPGLELWKRKNLLLSALTLPRIEGEPLDDFSRRIEVDAAEQGKRALERGTEIHAEIERALCGGPVTDYAAPVLAWLKAELGDVQWFPERSFASPLGYGGKIDLCAPGIVIDFKTSDFGPDKKMGGWDEQVMQLAAYAVGLDESSEWAGFVTTARVGNLFVSTREPGILQPRWYTPLEIHRGWEMFVTLLSYWKAKRGIA